MFFLLFAVDLIRRMKMNIYRKLNHRENVQSSPVRKNVQLLNSREKKVVQRQ